MGLGVESAVSVTGVLNQVQDDRNGAGDGDYDDDYDDDDDDDYDNDNDDDNDQIVRGARVSRSRVKSTTFSSLRKQ